MKITILGSGSSIGSPVIGCKCKTCLSENKKNHRTRASIFIECKEGNLLVDSSPDLRAQALANNIEKIDKVFYTHQHADHIAGIDDLRSFNYLKNGEIEIYGVENTLDYLQKNYQYCFAPMVGNSWYKPLLKPNYIEDCGKANILGHEMEFVNLPHGGIEATALKIGKFCFSTDFKYITQDKEFFFEDLDLWIVDCLKFEETIGHLDTCEALNYIKKFKPKKAVLFHLAHEIEYEEFSKTLPENVFAAYDGMKISFP